MHDDGMGWESIADQDRQILTNSLKRGNPSPLPGWRYVVSVQAACRLFAGVWCIAVRAGGNSGVWWGISWG
jgi:hypothetical protein